VDLRVRVETVAGRPVVALDGAADLASVAVLHDALQRVVTDHPGAVVAVDLDGASVVDDMALGVLLGAAGRARSAGGDLEVVATSPRTRARMALTRFDHAVTVRDALV
jgi:anti-anti-sigma factor